MPGTWWRGAVIYQVYPRSFADGNGDGARPRKLRDRLPYLARLGVDALWLNPWYPSPMADGGYDVADYRDVAAVFGTLAEAEALIGEAHAAGLRIILDVVPNHSSHESAWFREAVAAGPGSPERERFWFRPGRDGGPPNDWQSIFGGQAWSRVPDGEWYLHLFAPEQPDFNWTSPDVVNDFHDVLRFWFERGVGRHPHRLRRPPGEGPRRRAGRPGPVHRPGRRPRDLPGLAEGHRRLPGPDARRRSVAARPGALRPLPAPGRDAHRVQLRLPELRPRTGGAAEGDRHDPRDAHPARRAAHVGAVEP